MERWKEKDRAYQDACLLEQDPNPINLDGRWYNQKLQHVRYPR